MIDAMKEEVQKKSVKQRKFRSAPNLPVDESLIKGEDMFLVSQKDIGSLKKKMTAKLEEEKKKTATQSNKKKTKLNDKAVAKLLIEPIQTGDSTEQKKPEDYQWLIKKKVIKLMGSEKVKQGKKHTVLNKTTKKQHETKPHIQQVLQLVKSPKRTKKPTQKITSTVIQGPKPQSPKRRNTSAPLQHAALPKQKEETKQLSNIPTILRMTKPSLEESPNAQKPMERLKKIFSAFRPDPETLKSRADKKLDVVFSRELHRNGPPRKESKKKSTTKSLKPDVIETLDQMKALKETVKNKIRLGSALPSRNEVEVEAPLDKISEKKKRRKPSQQKLVYTVTA